MAQVQTIAFRRKAPTRSKVAPRNSYRDYKGELRENFGARCGYCDGLDDYFGGSAGSHIDHFAPRSKFPHLETVYDNLVYSCPFCNRAKSNKWIGDDDAVPNNGTHGFVDPCSLEFDKHLARDAIGRVVPLTQLGEYMVKNLNMRLIRHRFIWQAQRLDELAEKMETLRPIVKDNHPLYVELLEALADIFTAYRHYRRRANEG